MADAKMGRPGAAPDFDELRTAAEGLVPVLRERAPRAEELRRLPDETIADLHRTGLFRILQPGRVGGSELPFRSIVELVAVIGRACGSTAWVLANLAAHHWLLGMWAPKAQDEIWGESPDNLIGSALIFPRGRAKRVEGGYRLTGRWPFSSGIDAAAWNLFGAIVHDEEAGISEPRIFLVPASDYTIIDTWHVIGLAGTGSKDVAA
jgi:3-hydroxy-9,10-secoandrosta-1,3,5(10)-triene-9,17-dione monooxygenase